MIVLVNRLQYCHDQDCLYLVFISLFYHLRLTQCKRCHPSSITTLQLHYYVLSRMLSSRVRTQTLYTLGCNLGPLLSMCNPAQFVCIPIDTLINSIVIIECRQGQNCGSETFHKKRKIIVSHKTQYLLFCGIGR